jgi:Transglycosylase SLT domain
MKLAGRVGIGERVRRERSPWARLAVGAAGLFFVIVAIASMGAVLSTQAGTCGAADPGGVALRGVPRRYVALYMGAAERFALGEQGPAILAAVHKVESDFGRSRQPGVRSGTNAVGAAGPMQFLASTWRRYGIDADGDRRKDVYEPADAIYGAANYLAATGAPRDWYGAIFAYNHADWYVRQVFANARRLAEAGSAVAIGQGDASCAPAGRADLNKAIRLYRPRAFKMLPRGLMAPGYGRERVDARIYSDAVWIARTYGLRVTAAREAGHNTHGDGTALDMVPAGSQALSHWEQSAGRLARDLGWAPACGRSGSRPACHLVPAIQFVGYNGYPGHGDPAHCWGSCGAHIHVSWVSSSFGSAALSPPPAWVLVFPVPGGPG